MKVPRLRGGRIVALGFIPSNESHFTYHGEHISEDPKFRVGLVGPVYRNLCDAVSTLLRDTEQLEVKAVAID
jgi:hypothetical protein